MRAPVIHDPVDGFTPDELRARARVMRSGQRKAMEAGDTKSAATLELAGDAYDSAAEQATDDDPVRIDWSKVEPGG